MSAGHVAFGLGGIAAVVAGLFVGLTPEGFCGSAFRPALDPSGGGCAPLLDSPRLLAVALLVLGLVVCAGAAWRVRQAARS